MAGKKTVTVAGLLLSGGLLVTAACSSSSETSSGTTTTAGKSTATTAPAKGITVSEPWCRATAESATTGACYMVISNGEKTSDKLTKASVPTSVAGETQIHETVMSGGGSTGTTMKMGGDSMGGGTTGTTMKKGTAASSGAQAELTAYGHEGEEGETGTTGTTMGGMGGGAMTMQEVSSIEIPAGGSVQLKPGGYHIMLMELAAPLKKGETVAITLTFEKAGTQTVQAPVKDA